MTDHAKVPDLAARWRMASLEPYTDAPQTTGEWLKALELGADAAVCVVLNALTGRIIGLPLDEFDKAGLREAAAQEVIDVLALAERHAPRSPDGEPS